MEDKNYYQNIRANTPFQQQVQVLLTNKMPWQIFFKIAKILTIAPYAINFPFSDNSKSTYNLANVFTSKPVVIHKH